jgi:hypothetical protein
MQTSRGSSEAGEPATSTPDRVENPSSPQDQLSEGLFGAVYISMLMPDSLASLSGYDDLPLSTNGQPHYSSGFLFRADLESERQIIDIAACI